MMNDYRDIFISHAGLDKKEYIGPLTQAFTRHGISYWLDSEEISWGDRIVKKINEALAKSQFVLLCLSKNYIARPWPENEMEAALSIQNNGVKRVLPLILNSQDEVLAAYPLIAGLAYRQFSSGVDVLASELVRLVNREGDGLIEVVVESVHDGRSSTLTVPPRASIVWLTKRLMEVAAVKDTADAGAFETFRVRWVLVDARAEAEWDRLPQSKKRKVRAIIKSGDKVTCSYNDDDRLNELGINSEIVFHLHAIENQKSQVRYRKAFDRLD